MKRHGSLFEGIVSFENLVLAAYRARRGKRFRGDVLAFNNDMEDHLHTIGRQLLDKTYAPGAYKTFVIFEPKRRYISAAPYADRVVHHALCAVIEPLFNPCFISSCYANRKGKGTHKAH